jgi:protein ImuB
MLRALCLWVPDWPVLAAVRDGAARDGVPLAVIAANRVIACSSSARAQGVKREQRRREAQSLCPALTVLLHDDDRDHRLFSPLVDALESLVAGVQVVRPGLVMLGARGPARYYGGERAAALGLRAALADEGVPDSRAGVADGAFTADLAARGARLADPVLIVPPGASASFLAPHSVATLDDPELTTLLGRLGVRTLGEFAALPADAVRERFGARGAHRHALASAIDVRGLMPRIPPLDLERIIDFEPPLDRVDQVAFAVRRLADEVIETLASHRLVATAIRIGFRDELGGEHERAWLHPRSFRPSEIVDRVRWQLSGATRTVGSGSLTPMRPDLRAAITRVRIVPESLDALAHHEPGLWGSGPDERVHHALSRVQSLLGHEAVLTAQRSGGRTLAERRILVPWGDRAVLPRPLDRPWPGALPQPAPATVYSSRHPVVVVDARGDSVVVDDRLRLSAAPVGFAPSTGGAVRPIASWAGPWPLEERWWDPARARRAHRLQVVDAGGVAWLLVLEGASWWAEAKYD